MRAPASGLNFLPESKEGALGALVSASPAGGRIRSMGGWCLKANSSQTSKNEVRLFLTTLVESSYNRANFNFF